MKNKKTETFVYEGLGFPITLINCPMKMVFGEWMLDINLDKLQTFVLNILIHKSVPLTGSELRFIRKFLELTTTDFGRLFGVSHPAVLKWESEQVNLNPSTELCIRLYVLKHLHAKDKEFRKLYDEISIESLVKHRKDKHIPIHIDAQEDLLLAS